MDVVEYYTKNVLAKLSTNALSLEHDPAVFRMTGKRVYFLNLLSVKLNVMTLYYGKIRKCNISWYFNVGKH